MYKVLVENDCNTKVMQAPFFTGMNKNQVVKSFRCGGMYSQVSTDHGSSILLNMHG